MYKETRWLLSSFQSFLIRPLLRLQRLAQHRASIEFTRRLSGWTEKLYSIPPGVSWSRVETSDLTYEWLTPAKKIFETVLFYIHGGGFVLPLYNPSRYVMGSLARQAGMRVLCAEYRLAPEFPYPCGLDDCLRLYRLLVEEGILDPKRTIFIGESAGANLAIASLIALRDSGQALPAAVVTISPAVNLEMTGDSLSGNDPMVSYPFVLRQFAAYCGIADRRSPCLSPVHADLHGLPPILVQVGSDEIFRGGAEHFANRAGQAGITVTYHAWHGMWHYWHLFTPWLPEARQAMDEIACFVQQFQSC